MKLHLPITLLSAVLAAFIALPVQAVEAPEGYTTIYLNTPGELESYSSLKNDEYIEFVLENTLNFSPTSAAYWTASTPLISGGNVFFGSNDSDSPVALSFKDGEGPSFSGQKVLTFDTFSNLTFSSMTDRAFRSAKAIIIRNINDDQSETVDVLFKEIKHIYSGGAIQADDVTIYNNGDVALIEISSSGGAIDADNVTIRNNGNLFFSKNSSSTGAIRAWNSVHISDNGDVSFSENSAYSSGAIDATNSVHISDNGNVTFSNNFSEGSGGAISASDVTISDNNDVTFNGNACAPAINSAARSYGGAIDADNVTIRNNNSVTFCDNSASYSSAIESFGSVSISSNGVVTFKGNSSTRRGVIFATDDLTISDNGSVSFSDNSSKFGAIGANGALTIYNNDNVSFSNNSGRAISASNVTISYNDNVSFSDNSSTYNGGAIDALLDLLISDNGNVSFSDNSSTHYGGAIYAPGTLTISNNGDVSFSGNYVSSDYFYGGAIYANNVTISNNGNVSFSDNSSTSSGGAIYANNVTISNNGDVSFSDNSSTSSGGAINTDDNLTIRNNGNVSFYGNYINKSDSSFYDGGAIYTEGDLNIHGNDNVLFEKNYVLSSNSYHLRSLCQNSTGSAYLSAKTGGNITFHDSVYISGDSYFNSDYTDGEGNTQSAKGDIIFSGKYAEQHLNEILAANNEGRTATAEEILNSQTSEIRGNVYVDGGSVQIEDGAVLQVKGNTINIAAGSNATLAISDAELVASKAKVEVGATGTLQLSNGASVTADQINIAAGATLVLGDIAITTAVSDAMEAAYRLSSLNIINADLTFAAGSTLVTDGIGISMTRGSILTFNATSEGEKVNLILTLGAEYSENEQVVLFSNVDIVKFLMDGKGVDSSTTLLASDFFTGACINENTTLTYDSTSKAVYLQGVSKVVPEPTTATLSLLALAALAMRRRRK